MRCVKPLPSCSIVPAVASAILGCLTWISIFKARFGKTSSSSPSGNDNLGPVNCKSNKRATTPSPRTLQEGMGWETLLTYDNPEPRVLDEIESSFYPRSQSTKLPFYATLTRSITSRRAKSLYGVGTGDRDFPKLVSIFNVYLTL